LLLTTCVLTANWSYCNHPNGQEIPWTW
jgi:hypothetical protein